MHSGDQGILDEDGFLEIVGRVSDMVVRGGENIYPKELEDFYRDHPAIADIQVVGVPDERMGEELCAWYRVKEDMEVTKEDLKKFSHQKIAHFKVPKYMRKVDSFPLTVTGKV
jgi:fatty-acyl-CoA synthase